MDIRKQYGGHHWSHFRYRQVTPLAFSQQSANVVVSGRRISEVKMLRSPRAGHYGRRRL
jgi:hypothetical protein